MKRRPALRVLCVIGTVFIVLALPMSVAAAHGVSTGLRAALFLADDSNNTVGDFISGGTALGGAGIGAFLGWLGARQLARRGSLDSHTVELEDNVFNFAEALARELDATTDAERAARQSRTMMLSGRIRQLAERTNSAEIRTAVNTLLAVPDVIRGKASQTERVAILNGEYKAALDDLFGLTAARLAAA